MTTPEDVQKFDVVIVGYGPVGAAAAGMLGLRGWSVAVVDRMKDVYPLPRAVNFDGEIMRLFQELGLAEELSEQTEQGLGAEFLDAKGNRIEGFDIPKGATGAHGWLDGNFFHQPGFERALRRKAESFPRVSVFLGHEAGTPDLSADGVSLEISPVEGGEGRTLSGDYLLAADGAASPIRKSLGIEFKSLGYDCDWLVIDVLLNREVELPKIAQQVCDPERLATFVPIVGKRRRWEFRLNEGETREEILKEDKIWELMKPWMDRGDAEIERSAVYQFHAATADKWKVGRVILIGDAAHQTPPFLGQGMCTGMRDVMNLVWKLDYVKRGLAPDSLLDTYQEEREPHAFDLVDHAVAIGKLMEEIADAQVTGQWPENMDAIYGGSRGFPRLHTGVLSEGSEEESGKAFGFVVPQPKVKVGGKEGRRLDDVVGPRFAILSKSDLSGDLTTENQEFLEQIDAQQVVLPEAARESAELDLLFAFNDAIIVRPDKYVFGVVNQDRALNDQLDQLRSHF